MAFTGAITNARSGVYRITSTASATGNHFVTYVRWIGGAASGDQLIMSDGSGSIWFDSQADGADFIDIMPIFRVMNGLHVKTIDSGVFYIYTR